MRQKFLVVGSGVVVNISIPPFTVSKAKATNSLCCFQRALLACERPPPDLSSAIYRYGLLRRKNKVFAGAGMVIL